MELPNYATLAHHRSNLSPTPNEGLRCIPFYYSKMHLSNSPNTSSNSNNNNNDGGDHNEDEEAKALLVEDRKKKRMFSNRESARRSRMRKKQQIESLQCQLDHLQTLNRQLSEKIIYLLECNQQVLQHNAQLKDKVSSLQVAMSEVFGSLGHVEQRHHFHNALVAEPSSASAFH